ncbi:MAG: hypothetical protein IPM52_12050 [Bacteroidetes bacterium]|nr:hypothetical protein [Bacteroidota bacterium]
MKTTFFRLAVLLAAMLAIVSCNKDKKISELPADQAKVEIRNATQAVVTNMDAVLETPAAQSLMYMSELMDGKKAAANLRRQIEKPGRIHLALLMESFRDPSIKPIFSPNKVEGEYGIYAYNFSTQTFDLVQSSTTKLEFSYPADDAAYMQMQNNAVLTIDNLVYKIITYDTKANRGVKEQEAVPVKADVTLKINNQTQMTASYNSTLTDSGTPTAVSASCNMADYSMNMSMSGSGVNYTTTESFKKGNDELMGHSLKITYTSDKEEVEKVTGYYLVKPLKFDGLIYPKAIDDHITQIEQQGGTNYDFNYLNSKIDIKVIQTELNGQIGKIQMKLYTDPDDGSKYPSLALVYNDGTYEWLDNILEGEGYKVLKFR